MLHEVAQEAALSSGHAGGRKSGQDGEDGARRAHSSPPSPDMEPVVDTAGDGGRAKPARRQQPDDNDVRPQLALPPLPPAQ